VHDFGICKENANAQCRLPTNLAAKYVSKSAPPPPLEWNSFPPLVTAGLITPKGAESPGSGRIGVIGALAYFFLSAAVLDKLYSPKPAR